MSRWISNVYKQVNKFSSSPHISEVEDMNSMVDIDENVDGQQFSAGMRRLAGSCSVIATRLGDKRAGLTATAVCSVSADPAQLLVCVNKSVRAHELIKESGYLSVNLLAEHQDGLAKRFAGMVIDVRGEDRFTSGNWLEGKHGLPILEDGLVSFACKVAEEISGGLTHSIFICDVIDVVCKEEMDRPLIYFDREFSYLKNNAIYSK
jgi:flavin reductase (DIM6/NTAB) family NADH-FMN oxidoreductase RutF